MTVVAVRFLLSLLSGIALVGLSAPPVNAQQPCVVQADAPVVTHFKTGVGWFSGGTDVKDEDNPTFEAEYQAYLAGQRATARIYANLPTAGNYIGGNYSVSAPSNQAAANSVEELCRLSGASITFQQMREELTSADQLKALIRYGINEWQIIHMIPFRNNLFSILLPPRLQPGELMPFLMNGMYDLNESFVAGEGPHMRRVLGKAFAQGFRAAGILWNGQGATASRTINESAYVDLNDFFKILFASAPINSRRGITFGESRGGVTALGIATSAKIDAARIAYVDSGVPPGSPELCASLTSSTIPALLGATDWTVGFVGAWMESFRYPSGFSPMLTGLTGREAHLKILTGTTKSQELQTTFNLRHSSKIEKLNLNKTSVFLEIGTHDVIVPSIDQAATAYEYYRSVDTVAIKVNYLAGHWTEKDLRDDRLLANLKKLTQSENLNLTGGPVRSIETRRMDPETFKTVPFSLTYTELPLTVEVPRWMTTETPVQILVSGVEGRVVNLTFKGSRGDVVTKRMTVNHFGYAIDQTRNTAWPSPSYQLDEILDVTDSSAPFQVVTQSTHALDTKLKMNRFDATSLEIRQHAHSADTKILEATFGASGENRYIKFLDSGGAVVWLTNYGVIEVGRAPTTGMQVPGPKTPSGDRSK